MTHDEVPFDRIRQLERMALLAWPPSRIVAIDGWQMRVSDDHSKRTNSCAVSNGFDGRNVERSIASVVSWYETQGRVPYFHLTPAACPADLPRRLEDSGYSAFGHTQVMTRPMSSTVGDAPAGVLLETRPTALVMAGLSSPQTSAEARRARAALFNRVRLPVSFAVTMDGDTPVGAAYCAVDGATALIAAVHVHAAYRGQRRAGALLARLMQWAGAMGAGLAMLQVERSNATATALYGRAGFRNAYDYWYHRAD